MSNDGGPAFPVPGFRHPNGGIDWPSDGMTLRDYFAAKAMAAMITTVAAPAVVGGLEGAESNCAWSAYRMADAMLKYRSES